MKYLLLVLVLSLAGCAGNAAVIEALSKDEATFCFKLTSLYGTVTAARTKISSGDVTCDGLQVHSAGQVSVPVTVVPSSGTTPIPVMLVPAPVTK